MLYDSKATAFTLVTIPELMSVAETERYFNLLRQEGVPVTDLIVNRVEREHTDCLYCRARARGQKPSLKKIALRFKALRLHYAPLLPLEVRGASELRNFARIVWGEGETGEGTLRRRGEARKERDSLSASTRPRLPASPALRVLIFGGKGGVGKTTAAAAAALALAEQDEKRRILVFSIDPAHSLSDSFDEEIGEFKKGVAGRANLDAMEINPVARFEELKNRYRAWTDELFTALTGDSRWEVKFDREAMREIVELAPPGIDEIAALSVISDLVDQQRYARIVLDTAPTGHLLRFLELPQVALSWVRTFIKLLLKYKTVVRASHVAEELVALSKSIKRIIALLTDPQACAFQGIAIPERMSLEETVRLTRALERLKVPMRRLLINGVIPAEAAQACDFCSARRLAQRGVIQDFKQKFKGTCDLFIAPQQPHEVHGAQRLQEHFANWQSIK
jgi:arsenite-transporting ATPase